MLNIDGFVEVWVIDDSQLVYNVIPSPGQVFIQRLC